MLYDAHSDLYLLEKLVPFLFAFQIALIIIEFR